MLKVCEIFASIQGESTQAGRLCVFVRLSGCNLRCVWCDTEYAYLNDGAAMSVDDVLREVEKHNIKLVEITGGEPMMHPEVVTLCQKLLSGGHEAMIETNGSFDIGVIPKGVRRVVDVKCPGSGAGGSFLVDNLKHLNNDDELKFVLASLDDAAWAKQFCNEHCATRKCQVTFSPVSSSLPYNVLADWMMENRLDGVRLGIQLHKVIWGNETRK